MITQVLKGSNYAHCEDKQENVSPRFTDSPFCHSRSSAVSETALFWNTPPSTPHLRTDRDFSQ